MDFPLPRHEGNQVSATMCQGSRESCDETCGQLRAVSSSWPAGLLDNCNPLPSVSEQPRQQGLRAHKDGHASGEEGHLDKELVSGLQEFHCLKWNPWSRAFARMRAIQRMQLALTVSGSCYWQPLVITRRHLRKTDVAADIVSWRQALVDEATSLISEYKVCCPMTEEAVKRLEGNSEYEVVRVPGKIVASIKPPCKKKARLVACGNYHARDQNKGSPALDRKDAYCANMDTFSLRAQLATGALKGWTAASLDVRAAFLTAPFQPERGQASKQTLIVVRVPRVMVLAGIFQPNTWLWVQGALYGLRESPHSWGGKSRL